MFLKKFYLSISLVLILKIILNYIYLSFHESLYTNASTVLVIVWIFLFERNNLLYSTFLLWISLKFLIYIMILFGFHFRQQFFKFFNENIYYRKNHFTYCLKDDVFPNTKLFFTLTRVLFIFYLDNDRMVAETRVEMKNNQFGVWENFMFE